MVLMKLPGFVYRNSLVIGIVAMVLIIIATLAQGGSLLQKTLFLIGAPVLGLTAWTNKQKMFIVLQIVVSLGAVLAFFSGVPQEARYAVIVGGGVVGMAYLTKTNYSREDAWWPLGGLGLLVLAAGLATDAAANPLMFNSLLAAGGIIVALYSAIGFFHLKVRIAAIFLVLNIIFVINPALIILSQVVKP